MNDKYIKLEDAIDAVCGSVMVADKASAEEVANLLSGIKKRLSELPTIEVSEDCISRAELLKDMEELNVVSFYELDENSKDAYYELVDAVKGAPSVIPSRPHAQRGEMLICPNCGLDVHSDFCRCPRCGADMRGEAE